MITPNAGGFAGNGYTVTENAALRGRNTFHVPARAELLIEVENSTALPSLFALRALHDGPLLVLGEGSNVLFTTDFDGVVLNLKNRGMRTREDRGGATLVRVEAGQNWNDFVHWSLARGLRGPENLILIPGSAGAAPIQNIGAYGVEVSEFIESVEAYDRQRSEPVRLGNADCAFAYRDSLFKHEPERYVVSAIELLLPHARELRIDYAGIRDELATIPIYPPTPAAVAEAVMRLRTRKLPDPAQLGNAGSFFKNPILASGQASALQREHPGLPLWPVGAGQSKLSAAWFVEACGMKGMRQGDAGVSDKHALVLVNHGTASGADVWALAQQVRETVKQRFGVTLQPEPLIVGRRGPLGVA